MNRSLMLATAAAVLLHTPIAGAAPIEEISADSLDTTFVQDTGELKVEQDGVTVVVEQPLNVQQEVPDALFSLLSYLDADNSSAGKAAGDFAGGSILIADAGGAVLLSGDVVAFSMEEAEDLPFCVLAGAGTFAVTGGAWSGSFGPDGIIFDLTWKLDVDIDGFAADFTAESDVTLAPVPEPAGISLLALPWAALVLHKRRR